MWRSILKEGRESLNNVVNICLLFFFLSVCMWVCAVRVSRDTRGEGCAPEQKEKADSSPPLQSAGRRSRERTCSKLTDPSQWALSPLSPPHPTVVNIGREVATRYVCVFTLLHWSSARPCPVPAENKTILRPTPVFLPSSTLKNTVQP